MNGDDDPQPTSLRRTKKVGISATHMIIRSFSSVIRLHVRRRAYHHHRARNKSLPYFMTDSDPDVCVYH